MRHQANARTVTVKKSDLIKKIKENKEAHLKDYAEAVEAYKKEAQRQISLQQEALNAGKMNIGISLTAPVNKAEEYDKILTMFEWEINKEVELSQGEFNEYVLDETPFAVHAKMLNSTYRG
jgi:hypothetical protein